jgi:hypothetical protein
LLISEIYETDETRWEDSWFSNRKFQYTVAYNCLKFTFDGQEKKYCARVFMSTEGSNEGDYDDKKTSNKEGLDNLKRLKSKLHQLANDDSLLDRIMNFFKAKKIEESPKEAVIKDNKDTKSQEKAEAKVKDKNDPWNCLPALPNDFGTMVKDLKRLQDEADKCLK